MEITLWRRSSTELMSSNISDLFSKKSDNPSESVRKTRGDLDETEKVLVTTTDMVFKEGNNDMVKILMCLREPSLLLFQKRRFTQSTKNRNHKHPIK